MTTHDEQVSQHGIWEVLDDLASAITDSDGTDVGERDLLGRSESIVRFVRRWLDRAEPALVKIATLNSAQQQASAALTQLQNYSNNGNPTHLTNAVTQLESLLGTSQHFWSAIDTGDVGSIRDDVASFRKSASQLLNALEAEVESVRSELRTVESERDELRSEIDDQKGRLDSAIAEFQQQFSAAQESRSIEHESARSQRTDEHAESMKNVESSFDKFIEEATALRGEEIKSFSSARAEAVKEGEATLAELEGLRDEAAKVVGVVGNIGITGDYQNSAKQEKRQAFWWAVAALLFFIGTVVAAAYFLTVGTDGLGAAGTARRIALSLIVAAPASFCVSQSREHRTMERRNRSLELELASLDPFVAPLPPEYQQAMKAELAARYFRGASSETAEVDVDRWLTRFRGSDDVKGEVEAEE